MTRRIRLTLDTIWTTRDRDYVGFAFASGQDALTSDKDQISGDPLAFR